MVLSCERILFLVLSKSNMLKALNENRYQYYVNAEKLGAHGVYVYFTKCVKCAKLNQNS